MPDQHSWLAISASHRSEFHVDFLFSRLVFAFLAFRLFRAVGENAAATVRIGASSAISNSSLATIATPETLKHRTSEDPARYRVAAGRFGRHAGNCSRRSRGVSNIFWPARLKQMLDSCRVPAQAIDAAPTGGSASAAAPVRPTSCGDGHGTTGADCRQDRRGTRSGFGVAAFRERHGRERPLGPHQSGKAPIWPLPTV